MASPPSAHSNAEVCVETADDRWQLPTVSMVHDEANKAADDIWSSNNPTASDNSQPSKSLYHLSAMDFSGSGSSKIPKSECSETLQTNCQVEESEGQTVTFYDLNQNHEEKIVSHSGTEKITATLTSIDEVDGESQAGSSSGDMLAQVPCVVCGDKSSGKHYGQLTCEGCKSFFKRSVRRNLTYTCRGSRDCAVDPQHRNQCQYCRLRKCLKAGMRREAVQRGRVNPTSPTEYSGYQLPPTLAPSSNGMDNSRLSYMSNFVSVLLRAEPYPISHVQSPPTFGAHLPMDSLCELSARLLFSGVEWARNIPFFTELPLIDQVGLLRSCWTELFILNTAQCCPPVYIYSLLSTTYNNSANASSAGDTRFHLQSSLCPQDYTKHIQSQLERLAVLRIDSAEFSCLKALALFSPDVIGVHDVGTVQGLQEKTLSSLEEYDRIQYNNQPCRSGRLVLRLPALKTINPALVENLFFNRLVGKTPIETLIRDMLLGGNSFCWPTSPASHEQHMNVPQRH